jgi:hypothetical protein
MDPNETLRDIRANLRLAESAPSLAVANQHREMAMESFQALDEWLSKGGFKPQAWDTWPDQKVLGPCTNRIG